MLGLRPSTLGSVAAELLRSYGASPRNAQGPLAPVPKGARAPLGALAPYVIGKGPEGPLAGPLQAAPQPAVYKASPEGAC